MSRNRNQDWKRKCISRMARGPSTAPKRREGFGLTPGSQGSERSLRLAEGAGTRRPDSSFKEGTQYTGHLEEPLQKPGHGLFPLASVTRAPTW